MVDHLSSTTVLSLNQLVSGLPPTTGGRLMELRAEVRSLVKPYKRIMRDSEGNAVERIETPRFEIHVVWGDAKSVVVVLERWKPEYSKEAMMDFTGDEYTMLQNHIDAHGLSWENFFRQVVENG